MFKSFIFVFLVIISIASTAAEDLVFVNVSYSKDMPHSMRLYKSFESNVKEQDITFYIVVPEKDKDAFNKAFEKELKMSKITTIPNIITEEYVLEKCGGDVKRKGLQGNFFQSTKVQRNNTGNGWFVQQLVKFCFAETKLADNYLTLDSDVYFTKSFPARSILFKNGKAKTYAAKKINQINEHVFFKKHPYFEYFKEIKKIIGDKSAKYSYFVHHFGMWSSDYVRQMKAFLEKNYQYDFADILKITPYEMQWYGEFVYNIMPLNFYPMPSIFTLVYDKKMKSCPPDDGYPWDYGIVFYDKSGNPRYKNRCSKLKTFFKVNEKRVERWIKILKGQNV